jgi:sulfonate transport system substrate-binding protein
MTITRRGALRLIGAAVLAPAGASAASQVRIGYQRSSTLLTLLKANGTLEAPFAAKGLSVSWNIFDNVIDAMNTSVIDVDPDVADAVPIFTQSAGAPITFYARELGSPSAEAIVVHADPPIRSIADLKGKKVAVHRGSGSHFILAAGLQRAGLSFKDITPAYLSPSDASAAFERGRVDAWSIWDPFLALIESKVATRTICDATGLSSYHRYYAATTAFVAAHPDLMEVLFAALAEQGAWVKAHPHEAAEKLAPIWGNMPTAVIETANSRRTYRVEPIDKSQLGDQQKIADVFYDAHLIPKRIDATDLKIWRPAGSRT